MKKGFSLIELLVSLVVISVVMVFLTSFVLNLRDDKGNVDIDVPMHINQAAISRALNNDVIRYGGICNVSVIDNDAEITYANGNVRQLLISGGTLTYKNGNEIELIKTLDGNKTFASISATREEHGTKALYKYVISTGTNNDIEVVSYTDNDICEAYLSFTITWKNWDGTILETDTSVAYGVTPSYDGSEPTKAADSTHRYVFNSWTPAIATVTSNKVYTATYTTYSCNSGDGRPDTNLICTHSYTATIKYSCYRSASVSGYSGTCRCKYTTSDPNSYPVDCGTHSGCDGACADAGYTASVSGRCEASYYCPTGEGPKNGNNCYLYNQSSCGGWTVNGSTETCPNGGNPSNGICYKTYSATAG